MKTKESSNTTLQSRITDTIPKNRKMNCTRKKLNIKQKFYKKENFYYRDREEHLPLNGAYAWEILR